MEKIFEIASNVSTPLSLAGIFATILFFILREVIQGQKAKGNLNKATINAILKGVFTLAWISMLIGISAWVFEKTYKKKEKETLKFNVYYRKRPIEGITATATNLNGVSNTSNRDGIISLTFDKDPKLENLDLYFSSETQNFDTVFPSVPITDFPERFHLLPKSEAIFALQDTNATKPKTAFLGKFRNNGNSDAQKGLDNSDEKKTPGATKPMPPVKDDTNNVKKPGKPNTIPGTEDSKKGDTSAAKTPTAPPKGNKTSAEKDNPKEKKDPVNGEPGTKSRDKKASQDSVP